MSRTKRPRQPKQRGVPTLSMANVRIRSKLGLLLVIPIVAILGLAVLRSVDSVQQIIGADETRAYAKVSQQAALLNHALQSERGAAATYLTNSEQPDNDYRAWAVTTNEHVKAFRNALRGLRSPQRASREVLDRVDGQLDGLVELRAKVVDRKEIPRSTAIFRYRTLIADLITYRESLAQIAGASRVADLARGAAALSSYKEHIAQQQVIGTIVLAKDSVLTPARQEAFLATVAGQAESRRAFDDAVQDRHINYLQRTLAGTPTGKKPTTKDSVEVADRIASDIRRTRVGEPVRLTKKTDAADWERSMRVRLDLVRKVEKRLDAEFTEKVNDQRNELWRQVLIEFSVVTIAVLVLILVTFLTARSMARSLRRLREGALAVAYESLPQSVARLRNPETLGEATPDQVAAGIRDRLQVRGRDEIGQVSQAFNVVHREAVRIAAEQAKLRADVARMFINLARRSQVLVDRLIGTLDRLESGEEDPDRLARLFQLDHLATRMRRNDENLMVLAGADAVRAQREPAPLFDVLRAAQSEVEHYTRIEFGIVDGDVDLAAHAVNDVVHLLAELFDNATSFSSPDTVVVVDARRAGDRVILQIEDRGIGMSAEQLAQLNERLASPPLVDVAVSGMMGLVVVSRLAARHGISVELRQAHGQGTLADVILPAGTLILPQRIGRRQRMALPYTRSPLALEETDPMIGLDFGRGGPGRMAGSGMPTGSADEMLGRRAQDLGSQWVRVPGDASHRPPSPRPPGRPGGAGHPTASEQYPPAGSFGPPAPAESPHLGGPDPGLGARMGASFANGPPPAASNADDTTELPIFRDVESAWFRSRQPAPEQRGPSRTVGGDGAATRSTAVPEPAMSPAAADDGWSTVADDGWRRASAAAESVGRGGGDTTEAGLPKRRPMAQLVPGGVDTGTAAAHRSPEAVRGLLSAYHRGVSRGRQQAPGADPGWPPDNEERA